MELPEFKDWRGKTVVVGSTIVYPTRQGSNLDIRQGVVVSIEMKTDYFNRSSLRVGVLQSGENYAGKPWKVAFPDPARITLVSP